MPNEPRVGLETNTATQNTASPEVPATPPILLLLVLFWLSILGHEAAHFSVGALVYSPDELRSGIVRSWPQLLVVCAGPVFTMLLMTMSVLGARSSQNATWKLAWSSLVASAASRIAIVGYGTLRGTAINDEQTIGRILGISPRAIWCAEALVAVACIVYVARMWSPGVRPQIMQWIVVTVVVGWAVTLVAGPLLGLPI